MGKISRREFLRQTLTAGAYACCAAGMGPLRPRFAVAQSLSGNGRTLILFNLFGGCDPLNSFTIPFTASSYYDRRSDQLINVSIPPPGSGAESAIAINSSLGFHPNLTGLKALFDSGDVTIVQGFADPKNSRSHFTAQENMARGIVNGGEERRGWLGRFGDIYLQDVPFNTIGIGVGNLLDFNSERTENRPLITPDLSSYRTFSDATSSPSGINYAYDNEFRQQVAKNTLARAKSGVSERAQAVRSDRLGFYQNTPTIALVNNQTVASYPSTDCGKYFREAAKVVRYGVGTRVIYGGIGGWDTHSSQLEEQAGLLEQLNDAITVFASDMTAAGHWNNVLVCLYSEFGRNIFKNSSGGTDHGWGGTAVLVGGGVRGGILGNTPSATLLSSRNDLPGEIDSRSVFTRAISWLGFDPGPVFPESYTDTPLNLFL